MFKKILSIFLAAAMYLAGSSTGAIIATETVSEKATSLTDYTTDYDSLSKADPVMFSSNQVLVTFDVMVQKEGCVVYYDEMEWEVFSTTEHSFESDIYMNKLAGYDNISACSYCLVTANSPGTVIVKGTETSPYGKASFYWNFKVDADGNFEEVYTNDEPVKGDVNADGVLNIADVVLLQKWLLSVPDTKLANWKAADLCEDNKLNLFDLCLMKRSLIDDYKNKVKPMLVTISEGFSWDNQQTVEVFDQYGNLYTADTVYGLDDFYRITSDTWYEELCDIIQTHTAKSVLSNEITNEIRQYLDDIDNHQTCTMSNPKKISYDFGQEKLYVIYQDSEGKVCYQLLSNFGDTSSWQECDEAQRIVMDMADSGNYSYPNYYELLQ